MKSYFGLLVALILKYLRKRKNLTEKLFKREIIFWLNSDYNTKTNDIKKMLNDYFWDAINI